MAGNVSETMREPVFQIEEVNDPVEVARCKAQESRPDATATGSNRIGPTCCPGAGKFVAVAGQQAFIADTPEEAWAMAREAHPEDDGP